MIDTTNQLRNKNGSIMLGFTLIVFIILIFFIFIYEVAIMFILKEKVQNVADNASYSAILSVDEDELKEGHLIIDYNKADKTAKKIFQDSLDISNVFEKMSVFLNITDGGNEAILTVYSVTRLNMNSIFFNNVEFKTISSSRVYSKVSLEYAPDVPLEEVYNWLIFELK